MADAAMCLVCVFDGLRPDMVRPNWTPNLWRLRERGVWFENSHCAFPSVTRVNSASLATGSYPGTHGIEGNHIWRAGVEGGRLNTGDVGDLRRLRAAAGRMLRVPTLGEVLASHDLRMAALGTGTSGCAFLQHPEAEAAAGVLYHHEFSWPPPLRQEIEAALGPAPAGEPYGALAAGRIAYACRAITDVLIPGLRPAVVSLWITLPDGIHHRFGLGSPEAVEAIGRADASFGEMLARLETSQALTEAVDIFVTADHGYATVSGHIDVADELVRAGLKRDRDSSDVVVCVDGGSCLLYLDSAEAEAVASFLLGQPWIAAVFSRSGAVPGTLPLAAVGCEGPDAPDLLAALAWTDEENGHGVPGTSLGPGYIAVGAGDHGGISPFEMHNLLLAAGPHIRQGEVSALPCGVVDIAPTVLRCLGVNVPREWDGRVLAEALRDGDPPPGSLHEVVRVPFAGGEQVLHVSRVGSVSYTGQAMITRI